MLLFWRIINVHTTDRKYVVCEIDLHILISFQSVLCQRRFLFVAWQCEIIFFWNYLYHQQHTGSWLWERLARGTFSYGFTSPVLGKNVCFKNFEFHEKKSTQKLGTFASHSSFSLGFQIRETDLIKELL